MFRHGLIIISSLLILCGCAPIAVSTKLDADASPIQDITFAVAVGSLTQQSKISSHDQYAILDSLHDRVIDIFNKNGMSTKAVLVDGLDSTSSKDIYPLTLVEKAKTSHVLLLKADKLYSANYQPIFIEFNAQLIDVKIRKVVWKGKTQLNLGKKYNLQAQSMAGAILNSLNKDGLIHLKQETAVDMDGQSIKSSYGQYDYEGKDH